MKKKIVWFEIIALLLTTAIVIPLIFYGLLINGIISVELISMIANITIISCVCCYFGTINKIKGKENLYDVYQRYIGGQQYDEAIKLCLKQIDEREKNKIAWNNLALAYFYDKNYKKTIETCKHIITSEKRPSTSLLSMMGKSYKNIGNFNEAINTYNRLLEIDPKNTNHWSDMGSLYFEKNNLKKALEHVEKALKLGYNGKALKLKEKIQRNDDSSNF